MLDYDQGLEPGFLMQFQADLLGCPVEVAAKAEQTALGAAALGSVGLISGMSLD